jgi:hypothetical protein
MDNESPNSGSSYNSSGRVYARVAVRVGGQKFYVSFMVFELDTNRDRRKPAESLVNALRAMELLRCASVITVECDRSQLHTVLTDAMAVVKGVSLDTLMEALSNMLGPNHVDVAYERYLVL